MNEINRAAAAFIKRKRYAPHGGPWRVYVDISGVTLMFGQTYVLVANEEGWHLLYNSNAADFQINALLEALRLPLVLRSRGSSWTFETPWGLRTTPKERIILQQLMAPPV